MYTSNINAEKDKFTRLILRIISYYDLQNILVLVDRVAQNLEKQHISVDNILIKGKKYQLVITTRIESLDEFSDDLNFFFLLDKTGKNTSQCAKPYNLQLNYYDFNLFILKNGLSFQKFNLNF